MEKIDLNFRLNAELHAFAVPLRAIGATAMVALSQSILSHYFGRKDFKTH